MAYLPQNLQDEQNQQGSQVLGSNVQQVQPQQQAPIGGPVQSATIEGSQPGQAPQSSPKKASSGQFTNLKNYLQASQGAGQKIGQQLTGGMQKQAQQIGQAINQQKQQYQSQIQQQESQRSQAGQQAQEIIQKVQGLAAPQQAPVLSQEEISKYRELATGNKTFQDIQDMNLAQQKVQQEELARKAEAMKTFEGRQGQLRETFGKQKQYGLGSQSLDNLLLQNQGLQDTLSRAKSASEGAQGSIKSGEQFGRNELARLIAENKQFAEGLQQQAEGGQTGVISTLDQLKAQKAAQRKKELDEIINPTLAAEKAEITELKKYYDPIVARKRLVDSMKSTLGNRLNQSIAGQSRSDFVNNYIKSKPPISEQEFLNKGMGRDGRAYNVYLNNYNENLSKQANELFNQKGSDFTNQILDQYIKTGEGLRSIRLADDFGYMQPAVKAAFGFESGESLGTLGNIGFNTGVASSKNPYTGRIFDANQFNLRAFADELDRINSQLGKQETGLQKSLDEEIKKATGYGFQDYTTGADLSRESLASDLDRAKYSALSALAGKQASDLQLASTGKKAAKDFQGDALREMLASLTNKYGRIGTKNVAGGGVSSMGSPVVKIG